MATPTQDKSIAPNHSTWYTMTPMQVAQEFQVDLAQGLTSVEAAARLKKYGPNLVDFLAAQKKSRAPFDWTRLYKYSLPFVLLVVTLLSLLLSDNLTESFLLAALTLLSVFLGGSLDVNPEAKGFSFKKGQAERIRVRRDGQLIEIDAVGLVPGDIVVLTTGDRVPADGRLFIAARLNIDESTLSGGNIRTAKETIVIEQTQPRLGERTNMAFMNTVVTHGYGAMIVTNTGVNTKIGRINGLLHKTTIDKNPLVNQYQQATLDMANLAFARRISY